METLKLKYIYRFCYGPHASADLAGLQVRAWYYLAHVGLPIGHNSLPVPVPTGTDSHPYPCPPGRVPMGTRVFSARCHLYVQ